MGNAVLTKPNVPHGTRSGYSHHGCHCDLCREANVDHVRQWRQAHPDRARRTARNVDRKWRAAHPQEARDTQREKRRADLDRIRERDRRWSKTPQGRLNNRLNAQRRRGALADSEAVAWARIVLGDPCSYCGAPPTGVDHVVPLSAGGDGHWANLTSACTSCNASKHARPLLRHLQITFSEDT